MKLILWSSFNTQNKRFCSSSKNKGTYANDAKNVNKDSPIDMATKSNKNLHETENRVRACETQTNTDFNKTQQNWNNTLSETKWTY